jgi:fructose-bisphosphate aldolase class I
VSARTLSDTARAFVAGDKGLLAHRADRGGPSRLPRPDRDPPGLGECISGAILYDETIHQQADDGTPIADVLVHAGIMPGIKVDIGAKDLAGRPAEQVTEGLDGLRTRLASGEMGARFTEWRGVIAPGDGMPSSGCIAANAHALARSAATEKT